MEIPSIRELADMVMDLVRKKKMEFREALYSVAEEYEVSTSLIAKELSKRGSSIKKKKRIQRLLEKEVKKRIEDANRLANKTEEEKGVQKFDREETENDWLLTLLLKRRNLGCALHHEAEMQRGFKNAGHMDDY